MAKIQIIGPKGQLDKTVQVLQQLGTVQVEEWDEARSETGDRLALGDESEQLGERLGTTITRIDSLLSALPETDEPPPPDEDDAGQAVEELLEIAQEGLETLEPQVRTLTRQQDRLEEQLETFARYETTLKRLAPLIPTIFELKRSTVTAIVIDHRYEKILDEIEERLVEITDGLCEIVSRTVDQDNLVAVLVYPKEQAEAVSALLGRKNVARMRLPDEFAGQPIEAAQARVRQRLDAIPDELATLEAEWITLAQSWRSRLSSWRAFLQDCRAQIDVQAHFGQTDYTFVIEGWIPEAWLPELEETLAGRVGDMLLVHQVSLQGEEKKQAPVMFDNTGVVKPFEPLVQLLALPRHGAFDPTALMSLFMPIFFGLILGDIAYGAILLGLMAFVRQRFKDNHILRSLAGVLMLGAGWSIVFGFLYGEFFGSFGERFGLHPLWFHRGQNVLALFLLAIGIGAGHILLGLGLGVWEAFRQGQRQELMERIATLVSLAALFLLVATLAGYLPDAFFTPVIALLVVGVAILGYSMGRIGTLLGPLEFLGVLGNILSYLRLAAVGLASIYLAQVANELAGAMGNLLLGLIIAGLIHALNIALGAFSPTIQALRLHYVEFFDKFYEGGGQSFRPFKRSISG